ncbi:YciI family protein [Muricoccus radiodurans]|uniref:YciI family protein n=1 Tax=Muricoccus radiodurans TaxID=2231721 RepID=UPI003CE94F36
MKVMVLVKATAASEAGEMPGEAMLSAMMGFNEALVKAGVMRAGEGLHPSSRAARIRFAGPSPAVVSGPFPDPSSLVAGFWIWEVASMDDAIAWARRAPMQPGDELELRPVFSAEDFGEALTPELQAKEAELRAKTPGA